MLKSYIIHVRGNTLRENYIKNELKNKKLEVEFILDGNIEDLRDDFLNKYFENEMLEKSARTSCATKHILAYKKIMEQNDNWVLVLEDDMKFYDNFEENLKEIIEEIKEKNIKNAMISLEDSNLRYVARSEKKKNTYLYKKNKGRLAGAYLIDKEGARSILDYVERKKMNLPIDWVHNQIAQEGCIDIYWSDLILACQGSNSGDVPSLLSEKKNKKIQKYKFFLRRKWRKIVYFFR